MKGSKLPREFQRAAQAMVDHAWRPELHVDRVPGPQRLAPHAAALTAELESEGATVGSARLVLLHDPEGNHDWQIHAEVLLEASEAEGTAVVRVLSFGRMG